MHLHPYGLRYAPLQLWVNSAGRLMYFGNWPQWPSVAGHEAFAGLARHQADGRRPAGGRVGRRHRRDDGT